MQPIYEKAAATKSNGQCMACEYVVMLGGDKLLAFPYCKTDIDMDLSWTIERFDS